MFLTFIFSLFEFFDSINKVVLFKYLVVISEIQKNISKKLDLDQRENLDRQNIIVWL